MKKKKLTEALPDQNIIMFTVGGEDTDTILGFDAEHDAKISWTPTDGPTLRNTFHEYLQGYPLIDQFIDAAVQQPEAIFGFRAGDVNLPILISYRSPTPNDTPSLCVGEASNPDWFSTAGPDGDADEDDPTLDTSPGTSLEGVESMVSSLLTGLEPVREASGWLVAFPRHRQARGLAESIPTEAAEYLAALPSENVSLREGEEAFRIFFRFKEDANEFIQRFEKTDPVVEKKAEQIAFLLLKG